MQNNNTALPKEKIDAIIALYSSGKIKETIEAISVLNKDYPNVPLLFNILGVCYKALGNLKTSIKMFEKAIAIKLDYAEAHNNLGITHTQLGQLDAAVKSFKSALAINPNYAEAHNNLGIALKELNQLDEAVKSYQKAVAIKPGFAEANNNLGTIFKDRGQLDAAAKYFEKALAINPHYAYAHNNLGTIFKELGDLEKAAQCYANALSINSSYAEAHSNVGNLMVSLKRLDEALLSYEKAYSLKPEIDFLFGNLLHTKMRLCDWSDLAEHLNKLKIKINKHENSLSSFSLLALIDDPKIQMKAAKTLTNKLHPKNLDLPVIEKHPKHKKIRVGYFSADFRIHPVADLIVELFEIHDRSRFEIYAFSFGPDSVDEMNLRIKMGVDHFHDLYKMPHKEAAIFARSMELDIAIDLGGHTQNAPTEVFAISVAPTQVSYLGYAGTMGSSYIDYLIADYMVIPKCNQNYYAENIVYLPDCYMVNDSKIKASKKVFSRKDVGLPVEGFVFCCFNNHYKITPSVFTSWMRVLSKVTGSVLWLSETNSRAASNLKKESKINGIDPNRLVFAPRLSLKEDHLSRIQLADLFIDTLPFNAHVTASDALRVGLPVLTCIGSSFASRVAASLLKAVNLPELITTTQEQYESLAIELAEHPERLKIIKDRLHDNLPTTPLFDTLLFTKNIESAYLKMYDRSRLDLKPENIYI